MLARDVKIKISFVYPVVACAMLIYIYLEVTSRLSIKPMTLPYNKEDLLPEVKVSVARKDIDKILHLKNVIRDANKKHSIHSEDSEWGFNMIIVIQVHEGIYYLKQLVDSLMRAKGISNVLLLFSHSSYNEDINRVVWNVTFARVLQIYYPYSVQLHPFVFPGNDQKTCNEAMACRKSNRKALINQRKHHWWWTTNFVFDNLSATKKYNGSILFLEENLYVTVDFIYIYRVLEGLLSASNPHCDIISLGTGHSKISSYRLKNTSILLKPWSTEETLGIAFNKNTWKTMKSFSEHFCRYNDNRWFKSLTYLARKTSLGTFYVLSIESSRVFRFNKCKKGKHCNETEKVEQVRKFVSKLRKRLFPYKMHIIKSNNQERVSESNGGWTDVRDHGLCLYFTNERKVYA